MFRNYFKIAFRNLWRNKGFSAINITGLAIGIATCLIIMLFVNNELSYDRFNEKADRIVRISFQGNVQGQKMNEASVMAPVARTLKADFPEVIEATRIRTYGKPKLVYADKVFKDDVFAFVDSNFFRVFTLPLIKGDAGTALTEPNSIVITKAVAEKYFGKGDPIGKVISFKDGKNAPCKVTGMIDKVPVNAHFRFDIFASMASLPESREDSWMSSNFYTYLVLADGYDYKKLEARLPSVVDKYIGPQMQAAMGVSLSDFRSRGNDISFHLQPLTDIHLHSDIPNDLSVAGDIRYVYIFGAIALFMLLIACINFMNLSTAGASRRSKEVGVRKVMGSLKLQLVRQFIFESVIVTAIAMLLAILLMYLALPFFNSLSGKELSLNFSEHPLLLPGLLLFVLITGFIAGSYPAFYLSSFNPITVLKGRFNTGKGSLGLRRGLVVFQFFISIVLIVGTIVVYKQLSYIQHKDLGYNKDKVMIIPDTWMLGNNQDAFRQLVLHNPGVAAVSSSRYIPAGSSDNNNFFVSPAENPGQMLKTLRYEVDENYLPTLGIQLKEGRNFSGNMKTDSNAIILNEAAVTAFGWNKGAIGHSISRTDNSGKQVTYTVIGVVKNFHFRSLHEHISPLLMVLSPNRDNLVVKLKTADASALITMLSKQWKAFGAEDPFTFSFLDDRFTDTYKAEQKIGLILGIFAGLTIFVACLGLFGLTKFTAEQRTKEIGIRKVLGSSVAEIVRLLSFEFMKLVLIAFVIAAPVAWFIMNKWLQDFAYRIGVDAWVFILAGSLSVLITVITISFQSVKAAIANPVKSLRNE